MNTPFFSVIISSFNRAELLVETIHSVLGQNLQDFELLVVDDGSTDHTKTLVNETFPNNPFLTYIYQANSERGAARNNGIRHAKGQYLVFLDSDDLMQKNHLETLKREIEKNASVKIFATRYAFFNKDKVNTKPSFGIPAGIYTMDLLLEGNPFAVNFCIRNDSDVIPFETSREYAAMEDWIFLLANTQKNTLLIIDACTILMRDHPGRSMRSVAKILSEKRIKATELIVANNQLLPHQVKKLWSGSYYFSAIHYYIDGDRKGAFRFWKKHFALRPRFKTMFLLLKIIIGKRLIERIPH